MGKFFDSFSLKLHWLCAEPLNLPVVWQWFLTFVSSNFSLHIQKFLNHYFFFSSSIVVVNFLLKCSLIIWLIFSCSTKIHLIGLLTQSWSVKFLVGKVNLSSMHTNFAPIELGMYFWYNLFYSLSSILILFRKHSVSP